MALPSPIAVGQKISAALLNSIISSLGLRPAAASGSVTLTTTTLNAAVTQAVTFPAGRFATAPAVTVSVAQGTSPQAFAVNQGGASTNGVTLVLTQTSGTVGPRILNWIAVEQT